MNITAITSAQGAVPDENSLRDEDWSIFIDALGSWLKVPTSQMGPVLHSCGVEADDEGMVSASAFCSGLARVAWAGRSWPCGLSAAALCLPGDTSLLEHQMVHGDEAARVLGVPQIALDALLARERGGTGIPHALSVDLGAELGVRVDVTLTAAQFDGRSDILARIESDPAGAGGLDIIEALLPCRAGIA